jgi:uncharacterized protein (UPF0210 family)
VIRAITYTIDFHKINDINYLHVVEKKLSAILLSYEANGIRIRTVRFNVLPVNLVALQDKQVFFNKISVLSSFSSRLNVRWFNITFDLLTESKSNVDTLCSYAYKILKEFENSFVNLIVAGEHINNYSAKKASETIKMVSLLSKNGIDNFRLGVSLNVSPNTPFFPFSFSDTTDSFSIALEITREVNEVIIDSFVGDHSLIRKDILDFLVNYVAKIDGLGHQVAVDNYIVFNGSDLSLAPYPDEDISVIEILNRLGVDDFGSNGTQFFTSYLTSLLKEVVKKSNIKTIGFNGVMYSLLEDKLMCKAHDNDYFSIDSIILYSTVCGCGLDMMPLPCDVSVEEIASMIMDVATTSIRLNKPLGVRVLPIPGKFAGDLTEFKLDFLTNTKIPKIKNIHVNSNLFEIEEFHLKY